MNSIDTNVYDKSPKSTYYKKHLVLKKRKYKKINIIIYQNRSVPFNIDQRLDRKRAVFYILVLKTGFFTFSLVVYFLVSYALNDVNFVKTTSIENK